MTSEPKYIGVLYCPKIIPDFKSDPDYAETEEKFMQEILDEMSKPLDPDAPNTSCFRGPDEN